MIHSESQSSIGTQQRSEVQIGDEILHRSKTNHYAVAVIAEKSNSPYGLYYSSILFGYRQGNTPVIRSSDNSLVLFED